MPTRILVVDDEPQIEPLFTQRFRRQIREQTYHFRYALNAQQALDQIGQDADIDVLLLDINLPDVDGLSLLADLSERLPTSRAVMVSAYGDMPNIRTAMNRGAFDFVTKPVDFGDLELTIDKTARYVGQLRDAIRVKAVADLKARFFDNITHEFRTPLSLILAPVETLLDGNGVDETGRHHLTTVRRNAHQLLTLINQLLDLARLEADSLPVLETPGDLVALIRRVAEAFYAPALQQNVTLTVETGVETLPGRFDADKWLKISRNLLSNALKFTTAGGQVRVSLAPVDEGARLVVQDTGIGIAASHLPHIFDRFYQVDSSMTRAYEGSGIGLSLVSELVERLGGSLHVDSRHAETADGLPTGTTFTVVLPFQQIDEVPVPTEPVLQSDQEADWLGALSSPAPTDSSAEAGQPVLLLVEDNRELLAFVAQALANQYRVLTATDGQAGLEVARRELPDLIVSDLMMPIMDGYALTQHLRADPTTDHIPVVLLTARADREHRLEGLSIGADDYLAKPFDLGELQLRLRNLVRRQQSLREYYARQLGTSDPEPPVPAEPTVQALFLQKLQQIIEAHLDDSSFRADALADEVAMSVRTLTRKLGTIAGESPAHLIRTYRLRRATDFLRAGHAVSEAAYLVGFEHPANFTTAFREVFGQTPTDYVAQYGHAQHGHAGKGDTQHGSTRHGDARNLSAPH